MTPAHAAEVRAMHERIAREFLRSARAWGRAAPINRRAAREVARAHMRLRRDVRP